MSKITKGIAQLCAEAEAEIETWPIDKAMEHIEDDAVVFVDVRDVRELWRDGTIPGALHVPRGMLEFWVDPESPYARDIFQSGKRFVFFCSMGWRSALGAKAVQDMGLLPVCHIGGGFTAWREAGGPVETRAPKPKAK
jgi:rhodanese-related sulfurtransferase